MINVGVEMGEVLAKNAYIYIYYINDLLKNSFHLHIRLIRKKKVLERSSKIRYFASIEIVIGTI